MLTFVIDKPPAVAPHRPSVRAGVVRGFNAYAVPGVATVEAWPHRGMSHARGIARRLHRNPADYAALIRACRVPGVRFEARPAVRAA